MIDEFAPLVDATLRAEVLMKAAVIRERLVAELGFTGSYQRVKLSVQEACPRVAEELGITPKEAEGAGSLHRRFEVIPGALAQVGWGDEGKTLAHRGIRKVYSVHMTLSYSRDPFCCFTMSQDLETFFDCHRRAFAHFGGVPMTIVYDRTKTVARRRAAPGRGGAAASGSGRFRRALRLRHRCAGRLPAHRPRPGLAASLDRPRLGSVRTGLLLHRGDGRRVHGLGAPGWRAQIHKTHREVIGHRPVRDHAALKALPPTPYLVAERHLRPVGKDRLIAFGGNFYSVPARKVRPRQLIEIRATKSQVMFHAMVPDS